MGTYIQPDEQLELTMTRENRLTFIPNITQIDLSESQLLFTSNYVKDGKWVTALHFDNYKIVLSDDVFDRLV